MGAAGPQFEELLRRLRAGCPEAAQEIVGRYSDYIRRVIRRRLHPRLRSQYDSLDFVQSVWASFLRIPADRYTFQSGEDFLGFMVSVAQNKVVETYRQQLGTRKRDASREVRLDTLLTVGDAPDNPSPVGTKLPNRGPEPTPSQVVMAQDRWEQLLRNQPARYRRVLELLRQGYSHQEAAERVGINPRLVHRILQRLLRAPEQP